MATNATNASTTTAAAKHPSLSVNRTIDYSLLCSPEVIDVVEVESCLDEELPSEDTVGSFAQHLSQVEQEQQDYYPQQGDQQERSTWKWTELGLGEFS